jgi:hypothetical protein
VDSQGSRKKDSLATELATYAINEEERERAFRIWDCGKVWWVGIKAGEPLVFCQACKERLCPECQLAKYRRYKHVIRERMEAMKYPVFLTVTLKHNTQPLGEQLTRLLSAFRRLRSRAVWKAAVRGGIYAVEFKKDKAGELWHPHIHCLMDSKWLDKDWIKDAWLEITQDSCITWIEGATQSTPDELAKYITKAIGAKLSEREIWDTYYEIKGRRLAAAFGNQEKLNEDDEGEAIQILGPLTEIIAKARRGDPEATEICAQLQAKYSPPTTFRPPRGPTLKPSATDLFSARMAPHTRALHRPRR